jgi:thiol-disulfide isomerase/thioredoxin
METSLSTAELRGDPAFVSFWATWCGPCVREMAGLDSLWMKYRTRKRLGFAMVSVDQNRKALVRFLDEEGYGFPVSWDSTAAALEAFDVHAIPAHFLLDERGFGTWSSIGYLPTDSLEAVIRQHFAPLRGN